LSLASQHLVHHPHHLATAVAADKGLNTGGPGLSSTAVTLDPVPKGDLTRPSCTPQRPNLTSGEPHPNHFDGTLSTRATAPVTGRFTGRKVRRGRPAGRPRRRSSPSRPSAPRTRNPRATR